MDEHINFALSIAGIYTKPELESLWKLVNMLPEGSLIVEIGCMYGRSTSIYMQAAQSKPLRIYVIDNFCVNGSDSYPAFQKLRQQFSEVDVHLLKMTNEEAAQFIPYEIGLLHVDGDHSPEGITNDCRLYLPKLLPRGAAVFHDYNTKEYPQIKEVVDKYTKGWEDLGVVHSQAARRKPGDHS